MSHLINEINQPYSLSKYSYVHIQKQTNQQTQWWQSKCRSKGFKKVCNKWMMTWWPCQFIVQTICETISSLAAWCVWQPYVTKALWYDKTFLPSYYWDLSLFFMLTTMLSFHILNSKLDLNLCFVTYSTSLTKANPPPKNITTWQVGSGNKIWNTLLFIIKKRSHLEHFSLY